ncbi:MAG: hypothetical protein QM796_13090 [Chthoniobacteraceae bacterium]
MEKLRKIEVADWLDERRNEFASVDEQQECNSSLTAAAKMRVFRNALHARNKVGWVCWDQNHRTGVIKISKPGLRLVQKLFAHNDHMCVKDLLAIYDRAIELHCSMPHHRNFERDIQWCALNSDNLLTFITCLHKIVEQMGIKSAVKVYLKDLKDLQPEDEPLAA